MESGRGAAERVLDAGPRVDLTAGRLIFRARSGLIAA